MKKIILILFLVGLSCQLFAQLSISFPYKENFEAANVGWTVQGKDAIWYLETPHGAIISTPSSGSKAWVTKSPSSSDMWEEYYLVSPSFNLSARTSSTSYLKLSFNQFLALESNSEASYVEYNVNGGGWLTLGSVNSRATNWYNSVFNYYYDGWSNTTNSWRKVSHAVPLDVNSKTIQFRIIYFVDHPNLTSSIAEGIAVDDFMLEEIPKPKVIASDSLALVDLYKSTNGTKWKNNANWLVGNIDTWYGVTVNDGQIFSIELDGNNLTGPIPNSFYQLDRVVHFTLSNNNLTGTLTPSIGNLKIVRSLYLNNNQLSGSIPKEIGKLGFLVTLELSHNKFSGSLPQEITYFPNMWEMSLAFNTFTGKIPDISKSPELGMASLQNNKFSSIDPCSRGYSFIDLYNNNLSFEDLEPYYIAMSGFWPEYEYERYSPQDSIGEFKTFTVDPGSTLTLTAAYSGNSANNRYQWFKNGVAVTGIQTSATYQISNIPANFSAYYNCAVTNTKITGLKLLTKRNYVKSRNNKEVVGVAKAIVDDLLSKEIFTWPNPITKSSLNVQLPIAANIPLKFTLADKQGLKVYSKDFGAANTSSFNLDFSSVNLSPGVYFLTIAPQGGKPKVVRVIRN